MISNNYVWNFKKPSYLLTLFVLIWFTIQKRRGKIQKGENHVWQGLSNFFVLYLDSSGQFKNRQIATLELLIKVKYRPCKFWTFSEENLLVAWLIASGLEFKQQWLNNEIYCILLEIRINIWAALFQFNIDGSTRLVLKRCCISWQGHLRQLRVLQCGGFPLIILWVPPRFKWVLFSQTLRR